MSNPANKLKICSICGAAESKKYYFNPDKSGSYICVKDYLKLYFKRTKNKRKERYQADFAYREHVLFENKRRRRDATEEQVKKRKEKRHQKYLKEKESGKISEYIEKNKDRIKKYKAQERKRNAPRIFAYNAMDRIKNRVSNNLKFKKYKRKLSSKYKELTYSSARRGIDLNLSFEEYLSLVSSDACYYCNVDILKGAGYALDRKNNNMGYSLSNCVPCCEHCNKLKGSRLTVDQTLAAVSAIGSHESLNREVIQPNYAGAAERADSAIKVLLQRCDFLHTKERWLLVAPAELNIYVHSLSFLHILDQIENNFLIFRPYEILQKTDAVVACIYRNMGKLTAISAKDCEVRPVDSNIAHEFFNQNYLGSFKETSVAGLYFENELVAAFSYSVSYNDSHLEIDNIAFRNDVHVENAIDFVIPHISSKFIKAPLINVLLNQRYENDLYTKGSSLERAGSLQKWNWTDGIYIFDAKSCRDNLDPRLLKEKQYAKEMGWWKIYENHIIKFFCKNEFYDKNFDPCAPLNTQRNCAQFLKKDLEDIGLTVEKFSLGPFEIDVYLPDYKIGVEFNGIYWHSTARQKNENVHKLKYEMAKRQGIKLLQMWEDEWNLRKSAVKSLITSKIPGQHTKYHARACDVVDLSFEESRDFLDKYHLQGSGGNNFKKAVGLKFEGNLLMVAVVGSHQRQGHEGENILTRVCYAPGIRIVAGMERLMHYLPRPLITWSDNRYSDGNLYKACGFRKDKELPPDYSYVRGGKRFSKQSLRKTDAERLSDKTEKQLREEQGYHRLYDAGKVRWVLD